MFERERAVHSVYLRVLREHLSVCECSSVPFGFEGGMWDLIVFLVIALYLLFTLISFNLQPNAAHYSTSLEVKRLEISGYQVKITGSITCNFNVIT